MTLLIRQQTEDRARLGLPVASQLWEDSKESLPLAHAALAYVVGLAQEKTGAAVISPAEITHLPNYNFEQYCLEIKSLRFSDTLWQEAQRIYGVTLATRLCHQVGAFVHSPQGIAAYEKFISARGQVLCQIAGMTDC